MFRHIPGTEYEITSNGVLCRVGSIVLLKGSINGGYVRTGVKVNGILSSLQRLVLLAWVGQPPGPLENYVANHKNGMKLDNRLGNLEWLTQQDNCRHAFDTNLRLFNPRDLMVNKFDLDGTPLGQVLVSSHRNISQAVTTNWNHCEGFIYSFHDKLLNWDGSSIREIFPEYDPALHSAIDFDKIRPYVARSARPIAQWDIDGSPIALHDDVTAAATALASSTAVMYQLASETDPVRQITKHGLLRYGSLADVYNFQPRQDLEHTLRQVFQIRVAKVPETDTSPLDYSFLRHYLQVTGTPRPRPVWQLGAGGARVHRHLSGKAAETALGLGRATVDQAARKCVRAGGLFWEWADFSLYE